MAATPTTWHPRTQMIPKSWLLSTGEIVTEPPLEETASGRKVRIVGSSVSMFSKDVDALIFQGVEAIAHSKGAKVWMALDEGARRQSEREVYSSLLQAGTKPLLHLLTKSSNPTNVWWRFRHHTLPIEALLVVHMAPAHYRNTSQNLTTALFMQSTLATDAQSVVYVHSNSTNLSEWSGRIRDSAQRLRFIEFLRDNKPNWHSDVQLRQTAINGERQVVKMMLDDVQAIDGYDKIDVPDLRDPNKPAWLSLDLHDTNVSGEFVQSLKDYLDGNGVVQEVRALWSQMTNLLRSTGLVLDTPSEASFTSALAGGDPVVVKVQSQPAGEGHTTDDDHSVVLHLPTGTMIVNCSQKSSPPDQVAYKWEEALTMASLTGQEDVLLAYARRYAETAHERRAAKILDERKIDP